MLQTLSSCFTLAVRNKTGLWCQIQEELPYTWAVMEKWNTPHKALSSNTMVQHSSQKKSLDDFALLRWFVSDWSCIHNSWRSTSKREHDKGELNLTVYFQWWCQVIFCFVCFCCFMILFFNTILPCVMRVELITIEAISTNRLFCHLCRGG